MEPLKIFSNSTKLCRTCLKEETNLKNIRDTNITIKNNSKTVLEVLNVLTTIEFIEDFPDGICDDCIRKLMQVFKFKLQCENSNKLFEEYLNSKKINSTFQIIERENDEMNHIEEDESNTFSSSDKSINILDLTENNQNTMRLNLGKVDIEENVNIKSEQEQFCCIVCGYCFESVKLLLLHKKTHNLLVKCTLCDENFPSGNELEKHKSKVHFNIEEITNFACLKCRKTFKSKYSLTVHEKRHKYEGHFLCTSCGKAFNARACLNRHIKVHKGEKTYECSVCHKKFTTSNNRNLHFRIHSGEKPYLCTVCGKSFSHPTGLTYHLRTHTKERRYKCNFCPKTFAMHCHLDNHTKIHTGERPHACKQCDKAFIKKIDLQRHELTHSGVKPHVCTVCDKEFLRPLHLKFHMMIHTAERPHRCSYCGKGFIRRFYLRDHMLKHHGVEKTKKAEDLDETGAEVENEQHSNIN